MRASMFVCTCVCLCSYPGAGTVSTRLSMAGTMGSGGEDAAEAILRAVQTSALSDTQLASVHRHQIRS